MNANGPISDVDGLVFFLTLLLQEARVINGLLASNGIASAFAMTWDEAAARARSGTLSRCPQPAVAIVIIPDGPLNLGDWREFTGLDAILTSHVFDEIRIVDAARASSRGPHEPWTSSEPWYENGKARGDAFATLEDLFRNAVQQDGGVQ